MICLSRLCRCRAAVAAAALLFVVPVAAGCALGQDLSATSPVAAHARTRGGVRYDPSAPLHTVLTPRFDPGNPPLSALTYAVTFDGANGQTVPALFVAPVAAKGAPCVLLLHGLGGSKEQMFLVAAALAQKGYASLAIDAAGHGGRPRINGKAVGALDLNDTHLLAAQTVADLARGVDFLQTRPEVDQKRIGYLGISMGAILGGVFIGDDARIKAAVLWAGGGDWGKLVTTSSLAKSNAFRGPSGTTQGTAPEIEKTMADVDPINTIRAFSPRPLLFLNGDQDMVVPVPCAKELFEAAAEPKTRVVLPGGHIPDPLAMLERSIVWLNANLKP